jgi:ABC-type multidrug transport system fused ATPase/permease subunit
MLRDRWAIGGSLILAVISSVVLSVGLVGARPVLENILAQPKPRDHAEAAARIANGEKFAKDLREFAGDFNEYIEKSKFVESIPALKKLEIAPETIAQLPSGEFTALSWFLGVLAGLTIVGAVTNFAHAYLALTVVNRTATAARRAAYHAVLRAPVGTILRTGVSDTISRIVNDSTQLANGLTTLLSKAFLQMLKGVAGLLAALWFDWRVTLAALVVAPVLATVIRKLGKRIKKASGRALEGQAQLYQAANEGLTALKVVKVHTTEPYEGARFHAINKAMLRELNRVRTARALASPLTEALAVIVLCGLTLVAARVILKSQIPAHDFILAIGSLAVAGASLKPLSGMMNDIQAATPAAERLREIIFMTPEPGHSGSASGSGSGVGGGGKRVSLPKLPRHAESIAFEDVTLTYPNAVVPALKGFSLTIRHGERIAFVGPNGCGKTTLLGLVPRFYDPDSGRVLIDGRAIGGVNVRSLRSQIGMVTQETVLFKGTIRGNIAYGCPGASEAEIVRAATLARADEFVRKLPNGYDTAVAEMGGTLSGGQRQRIAIARALLRDPAVLILDEATSMIDSESESEISQAIDEFAAGRTTLIVAHRLSTVLRCHRIVVMDAGQIVDTGTHDELMQRCGLYQSLAKTQFLPGG